MENQKRVDIIQFAGIAIVLLAFFCISRLGYLWGDDYAMGYGEVSSLNDVFSRTMNYYFVWGGNLMSFAAQFFFCGMLGDNKLWYDLMNTLVFLFFLLVCTRLVWNEKGLALRNSLFFVLMFWLFCPVPRETMFWMVGSTAYLWATVLAFLFLWCFMKFKDVVIPPVVTLGLLVLSLVCAASLIPCVSICGAFVAYYLFHLKEFKGNAVPMVVGFVIGTLILLLAPGNFARASANEGSMSLASNLLDLVHHPIKEILKYRAFWLFLAVWVWGMRKDKEATEKWMKDNAVLLLSLGWSIIAFSIVFRPYRRALFFTETLSIVLFLRFVTNPELKSVFAGALEWLRNHIGDKWFAARRTIVLSLLFAVFVVDAGCAIKEQKRQHENNERLLNEIQAAGGITGVDYPLSRHRMAYAPDYPKWSWKGIAYQLALDSVHVYPYYCQDKYYENSGFGECVYYDAQGLLDVDPDYRLSDNCMAFVRIPEQEVKQVGGNVSFTIKYERPRKWYRSWWDDRHDYIYEKVVKVEKDKPDDNCKGFNYYVIWLKKENLLRSVEIEMDGKMNSKLD